ncbi:TPA: hypothetical protein ACH3X2_013424 [Trebouxia sp. C0005]
MALLTVFIVTLAACSHFCHVEGNTTPGTLALLQTFRDEMVKVGPSQSKKEHQAAPTIRPNHKDRNCRY